MTLSEKFENTQVCHATGIELDIIGMCDIFCTDHITGYKESWMYDTMQSYLTAKESDIDLNDLSYFTHETLQDYMNEHSPIGCYFGSHKSDATLGYWRILEYNQIGYEYENCQVLPYKQSGYPIFSQNDNEGDMLSGIETFLEDNYSDQFLYTELWDVITELTDTNRDSPFETVKFCEKIIDSFVTVLLPLITPEHMTWRLHNGVYGIYPEK